MPQGRNERPGEGKSGGYRSIVFFRQGEWSVFAYGFPKSERDSIKADEEDAFQEAAKHMLALTDNEMAALVKKGDFVEVKRA